MMESHVKEGWNAREVQTRISKWTANGKPTQQACCEADITAQTHDRWRKEFGGRELPPSPAPDGR